MARFRKMIWGKFGALVLAVCLALAIVVMGGMFAACDSDGGSTGPELTPTPPLTPTPVRVPPPGPIPLPTRPPGS